MKELFEVVLIVMLARFMWKGFRFFTRKDKRFRKSIVGKIGLLLSRNVHSKLDRMIVRQKENLACEVKQDKGNVVQLKRYKSVRN
jgi:hypothetical protein